MKIAMNRQQLLLLSAVSLAFVVIGFCVPAISLALTANIPQTVLTVGAALFLLGGLGSFVAWVSGIMTAARGQWGGVVAIVLFNVLGALLYALPASGGSAHPGWLSSRTRRVISSLSG